MLRGGFRGKSRDYSLGISPLSRTEVRHRFRLSITRLQKRFYQHDGRQTSDDRFKYSCAKGTDDVEYRELTNNAPEGILAGTNANQSGLQTNY
jgi:hypothetical protein